MPSVAAWLSGRLGMLQTHASCDLIAACAGLPYAVAEAIRLLEETRRPVLVVATALPHPDGQGGSRVGNTSSASIPLALQDAVRDGVLTRPMRIFAPGFGAGAVGGYIVARIGPGIVA